jgi:hypothetical protein
MEHDVFDFEEMDLLYEKIIEQQKLYKSFTVDILIEEIELAHDQDTIEEFKRAMIEVFKSKLDATIKQVLGEI